MPIQHPPYPGMILRCDFNGFIAPEMVKTRPVLVLSPKPERAYKGFCTIVALSTTDPNPIEPFHLKIKLPTPLPQGLSDECWVKGDMIYSLSYKRMDLYRFQRDNSGKRSYYYSRIDHETMDKIRKAVSHSLGIFTKTY